MTAQGCLSCRVRTVARQSTGIGRRPLQQALRQRGALHVRASSITSNDIRPGVTLEIDGAPWRVVEFLHVKPGKGAAFVRSKLKNCITGNTVDKTFRGGEPLETAVVERNDAQFTYPEGDDYVFMDMSSYEEVRVKKDDSWAKYMKEGSTATLVVWNEQVISVDIPSSVELLVTSAPPGVKGNSSSAPTKPVTVETGMTLEVPLFIKEGEKILVDTATDSYLGRAKS